MYSNNRWPGPTRVVTNDLFLKNNLRVGQKSSAGMKHVPLPTFWTIKDCRGTSYHCKWSKSRASPLLITYNIAECLNI